MASGIRLTLEEVSAYFKSENCELLESEYKNARTKMKYRCKCGNISSIVFYSFKAGNRCSDCGKKKLSEKFSYDQEEAKLKFLEVGCELIDDYKGAYKKVNFKCSCGRLSTGIPNNVWRRKHCNMCGIENRSGSNHYMWHDDREKFKERNLFKQRCYKLVKIVLGSIGKVKNDRTANLLGYNYNDLKEHVTNHPNWENVKGTDWHLDHIFPIKAFLDLGISDLKLINSLDNLRPIKAKENLHKNAKYDKKEFVNYLLSKGFEVEYI